MAVGAFKSNSSSAATSVVLESVRSPEEREEGDEASAASGEEREEGEKASS